jgi:hypothetical protein
MLKTSNRRRLAGNAGRRSPSPARVRSALPARTFSTANRGLQFTTQTAQEIPPLVTKPPEAISAVARA